MDSQTFKQVLIPSLKYYLCRMIRKLYVLIFILLLSTGFCKSQAFINTADLLKRQDISSGNLNIYQDKAIDSLISRYIESNRKLRTEGHQGMPGYRIQIYYSSVRNAREESARVRASFIEKFPDIQSYPDYQEPGWFIVRVGDYRTKTECYKDLDNIRKEFPDAYWVPTIINFPDRVK
jgi:hypothetical protein